MTQLFDITGIMVFLGAFVTVLMLTLAVTASSRASRKAMHQRVGAMTARLQPRDKTAQKIRSIRRLEAAKAPGILGKLQDYLPQRDLLKLRLVRAGLTMGDFHYLLLCGALSLLATAVMLVAAPIPAAAAWMTGPTIGVGLPHFVVGFMVHRRQAKFLDQFPDAIGLMVRGLRSGLPIGECIANVGAEYPDPIGHEFAEIASEVTLGKSLEAALKDMDRRLGIPEFRFFVISLAVQQETGGNLAETLDNLSEVLRRRRQMKLKIKAMSSEARASAMILGSLPFIIGGILFLINADYMMTLFTDPRGHTMIFVGLGSISVGILVMAKLVRFEI